MPSLLPIPNGSGDQEVQRFVHLLDSIGAHLVDEDVLTPLFREQKSTFTLPLAKLNSLRGQCVRRFPSTCVIATVESSQFGVRHDDQRTLYYGRRELEVGFFFAGKSF